MKIQADIMPMARVFFVGGTSLRPGWYVQWYAKGELLTSPLPVDPAVDAFDAVGSAAEALACVPDQIQVEGAPWPHRRFPM